MFDGIHPFNENGLLGTAFTVKVPSGDNLAAQAALDYAKPGDIIVIDGAGYSDRALVGGMMLAYAEMRGLGGFVVNGAVRDLEDCDNNRLSSLNLECEPIYFSASGNKYSVQVYESTRVLDPGILPGNFDISRVRNLNGAYKNADGTLTAKSGGGKVTYEYRCYGSTYETFTLNVTVIPEGIRIYGDNFPNYEFRQYLKANIDKDGNGYLNDTELNIRTLNVNGQHIANLKGIEFFPNLETLYCYNNKLTSLDVSKNPELKSLWCYNNQLTSLDVTQNTGLEYLSCSRNPLGSLDVSKNINLKTLYCEQSNLTSLDLSQNHKLEMLYAKKNRLTSLDLSQTAVTTLYADDNQIDINVETTPRTFDLSTLPGFDANKASGWAGGTVDGSTLKVDEGATQVTYTYDCGNGLSRDFTLNVKVAPEGSIGINASNFPDPNFRAYVKAKFDKDNDNFLSESERNAITSIDLFYGYNGEKVARLDGIEHFPNLESLTCSYNNLTSLDVSKNSALVWLNCMVNKLTSLDVSKNEKLETLACDKNQLSSLDVTQNIALKELQCTDNLLTSLDVSKNKKLDELWCSKNNLTSLDVSKNPVLYSLRCQQNNLSSLDVSKNAVLKYLYCEQNNLTSLDVSKNPVLKYLKCENNQLTSLNVEDTNIDPTDSLLSGLDAQGNVYPIAVETTPRTFDLSNLPGFDVSKASGWVGGTVDGSTLKVDEGATQVTYTYDCGKGRNIDFTLNVNVVPDSTVTPPSGGDGTGTTTPPSGGDGTGTTTPPSGGGTGTTTPPSGGGTGTTTPPSGGGTGTTTPPSGGDGTGTTTPPSGGGGGGAGLAVLAVGGTALVGLAGYGIYSYVSEQQLKAILPEGTAVPENRAQTALLLWNTAGRPEPAAAPAFADVADPDTAKAAQWCVEQNLLQTRRDGAFAPDSTLPAYKTLNAYRKLAG